MSARNVTTQLNNCLLNRQHRGSSNSRRCKAGFLHLLALLLTTSNAHSKPYTDLPAKSSTKKITSTAITSWLLEDSSNALLQRFKRKKIKETLFSRTLCAIVWLVHRWNRQGRLYLALKLLNQHLWSQWRLQKNHWCYQPSNKKIPRHHSLVTEERWLTSINNVKVCQHSKINPC